MYKHERQTPMDNQVIAPTLTPSVPYDDPRQAMHWLTDVLGFRAAGVYEDPDGSVAHAELVWRTGVIYVSGRSPNSPWANVGPTSIALAAEDAETVDRYYQQAVAAGAEIIRPLHDAPYGSHQFDVRDPGGNFWTVGTYQARIPVEL
jgi:uncharacterized glyoxalase superfamily protein PhnB